MHFFIFVAQVDEIIQQDLFLISRTSLILLCVWVVIFFFIHNNWLSCFIFFPLFCGNNSWICQIRCFLFALRTRTCWIVFIVFLSWAKFLFVRWLWWLGGGLLSWNNWLSLKLANLSVKYIFNLFVHSWRLRIHQIFLTMRSSFWRCRCLLTHLQRTWRRSLTDLFFLL